MSVRSRLEAAERAQHEVPEPVAPTTSRSMTGVGYMPPSTRQHNPEVPEETLTPPTPRTAALTSFYDNTQTSVRGRDALRAAQQEAQAPQQGQGSTSRRALIDFFADSYLEQCAQRERKEREEAAAKLKAQQERAEKERADAERHVWVLGVNEMFESLKATEEERQRILSLPTVKVGDNPDKLGGILLTLRAARNNAPAWVAGLKKN